jgi:hypothetical protein
MKPLNVALLIVAFQCNCFAQISKEKMDSILTFGWHRGNDSLEINTQVLEDCKIFKDSTFNGTDTLLILDNSYTTNDVPPNNLLVIREYKPA